MLPEGLCEVLTLKSADPHHKKHIYIKQTVDNCSETISELAYNFRTQTKSEKIINIPNLIKIFYK